MPRTLRIPPRKKRKDSGPICAAATRIIQLAVQEDCCPDDLSRVVTAEPALGMRVLALVNSSAFMLKHKVGDVQQAVSLLGVRGLRNLALSLVVTDIAPSSREGQVLLANSLRRGLAAKAVAMALGEREPDTFFTAGLFLDVGLLCKARDDLAHAVEVATSPAAHRVVLERAAGKAAHPEIGADLAREYTLAADTVAAIEHHHEEEFPASAPRLVQVCWVAERIAAAFEGGGPVGAKRYASVAAERIGLGRQALDSILSTLPEQVGAAAEAFERDVGDQPDIETLIDDANRSLVEMNRHYEEIVRRLERLLDERAVLERELRSANERLAEQATTDELTGLPNKRALQSMLAHDLARAARDAQPLSLIVVDVDHFKRFNDTWGHATGDEVLRCVGGMLKETVRESDVPARYGGEEFVVVLPNTDEPGAQMVAERIRLAMEGMPVTGPKGQLHVTASFGVATARGAQCRRDGGDLFKRADAALYEAKEGGRNQVRVAA